MLQQLSAMGLLFVIVYLFVLSLRMLETSLALDKLKLGSVMPANQQWAKPHKKVASRFVVCFLFLFFWIKSHLFNFTNKDSGARCWGESLLAQRGRGSIQLTFLLSWHPRSNPLLSQLLKNQIKTEQNPSFQLNVPPSTSCVSLSVLTPSFF